MGKLKDVFGVDLRSLALFRVSMAVMILVDLAGRFTNLTAHHTDSGVLPRGPLINEFLNVDHVSIHLMGGTALVQGLLFVIAACFAILMLVGYHTRLATFVSWFLLFSLHVRNPVILQAGDSLFRLLLFWGIFLPLGARYSIDHALAPDGTAQERDNTLVSWGALGLLLQLCFMYWFTAAFKWPGAEWTKDFTAVYFALSIDQFVTPLGRWIYQFPDLLKFITISTLGFEILGPMLIFTPVLQGPVRTVLVIAFWLFHVSLTTTMELGNFSWICNAGWTAVLPGWFWQRLDMRQHPAVRQHPPLRWLRFIRPLPPIPPGCTIYYDGDCGFCHKGVLILREFLFLRPVSVRPASANAAAQAQMRKNHSWVVDGGGGLRYGEFDAFLALLWISPWISLGRLLALKPCRKLGTAAYRLIARRRSLLSVITHGMKFSPVNTHTSAAAQGLAVFFLAYIFWWNIGTLASNYKLPKPYSMLGPLLKLEQKWDMFAPYPTKADGWYVIPGRLRDGTEVDLWSGNNPVTYDKPARVERMYADSRWRKYMLNLRQDGYKGHRLYFGRYLCRSWNAEHTGIKQLENFEIIFMRETTLPDYQTAPVAKNVLWRHECFKKEDK